MRDDEQESAPAVDARSTPGAQRRTIRELVVAVTLLGLLGFAVFRPWEPVPFPILDFGGLLAMLQSAPSAVDGFRAMLGEFGREGRVNPLSLGYIAANYALFDDSPFGWQMLRAAVMVGVVGAAYSLCRGLGARHGGAMAGAALFVISDSARSVWLMPQAYENIATLLLLLAALVALGFHSSARPGRDAALIAALLVLAIWVREPMVAAIPFVVLLALSHRGEGRLERPRVDRRSIVLVATVGVAVTVLNIIPVLAARSLARGGAYASRYGLENISVGNVKNVLSALLLPVTREPLFPANAVFVLAIVVAAVGAGIAARRLRAVLLLASTLPLCAAAIYVMWPSFPGNYALPYVPAIALAFALALSGLGDGSLARRGLAVAAAVVVIAYGTLLAINWRREYTASRLLDADIASSVSQLPSSQLVVAVDEPSRSGSFGRGVLMYTQVTRSRAPTQATDVDCDTAARLVAAPRRGFVVLRPPDACKGVDFGPPTTSLARGTMIREWKTFRPTRWETTAALWDGGVAQ